jgi:hypothetical protein
MATRRPQIEYQMQNVIIARSLIGWLIFLIKKITIIFNLPHVAVQTIQSNVTWIIQLLFKLTKNCHNTSCKTYLWGTSIIVFNSHLIHNTLELRWIYRIGLKGLSPHIWKVNRIRHLLCRSFNLFWIR